MAEVELNHINSDNISIFPIAKNRVSKRLDNRLLYEGHIANITSNIVDKNYVIKRNDGSDDEDYILFNINGYTIKIYDFSNVIESLCTNNNLVTKADGDIIVCSLAFDKTLEASVELREVKSDFEETQEDDTKINKFGGLNICRQTKNYTVKEDELILVKYIDKTKKWIVPNESKVKLDFSSLGITGIDGKPTNQPV